MIDQARRKPLPYRVVRFDLEKKKGWVTPVGEKSQTGEIADGEK